jgi:hypothetical protein
MKTAEKDVSSFYSLGTLSVSRGLGRSDEVKFLAVGTRLPRRLKVEIAHPWGAPIFHILLEEDRIQAFSYDENTLYKGPATKEALDRFLPGAPDPSTAWDLLRGYPAVSPEGTVLEVKDERFLVSDDSGEPDRWVVIKGADKRDPDELVFVETEFRASFSSHREKQDIPYAHEVKLNLPGKGEVRFRNEKMVFNRPIPEAVFDLRTPEDCKVVDLGT